jgi:hypothetical protein
MLEASNAMRHVNTLDTRLTISYVSGGRSEMRSSVPLLGMQIPADASDENMRAAAEAASELNASIVLKMLPSYLVAESNFDLSLTVELRQKTDPIADKRQKVEGTYIEPPAVMQASNHVSLLHGQTVVLERDIPASAWPPDFTNTPPPRKLIVFLTPIAIDQLGNPLAQ